MTLSWLNTGTLRADPADDFSFSLTHAPRPESFDTLSRNRVAEILRDRLDLFPASQTPKLANHLIQLCRQYRFDPAFILAVIQIESMFKIQAVSPVGALGLMQLMPGTALMIARDWGIYTSAVEKGGTRAILDPYVNMSLGVAYLAWLRDHYWGKSPYYILAAYNAGPGKIDELIAKKNFTPVTTLKYFQDIRRALPEFRYYRSRVGGQSGV